MHHEVLVLTSLSISVSLLIHCQALFFGGQDNLPYFLARIHVPCLDMIVDPCAAILVLVVTALLCLGIKEVPDFSYLVIKYFGILFLFQ
jgi:solute carrier family 7 (cationic amino acid transporter), member 1